ncbi:phosphocholine cytidylyltransferase family protein [Selenomonas caprae]|uniref:Phosphocholine cytidylyltransferase family protein n=1 Tax=Selenomonas caprae TaxID=2606905 RepID=A0A5D6WPX3_9FIRM|nr:phosphocholine cytidylyltransferase family protein [Selenomonas caprae]TYZ29957.1 phosphocholine cytidylyltransferase family protein [Selenomonas caprae]
MKAIILAAGSGTRLKKYTKNLPKGMLDFMGKTLIERQIEVYRDCGIEDIIIVRGFAADKISYEGIKYYTNKNYANTNMVESLMEAKAEFDDDIIVSYSDVLFQDDMLKKMMELKADFACAVDDNWQEYWVKRYGRVDFDTESLVIDDKDNIIELGLENPSAGNISARYIGILKFSVNGLKFIQKIMGEAYQSFMNKPWQQSGKTIKQAYMTDLLNAIIEAGKEVKAIHFNNGWIEFDTNEDYENALRWSKDGSISKIIRL